MPRVRLIVATVDPSSDWFAVPAKAIQAGVVHVPRSALVPLPAGFRPGAAAPVGIKGPAAAAAVRASAVRAAPPARAMVVPAASLKVPAPSVKLPAGMMALKPRPVLGAVALPGDITSRSYTAPVPVMVSGKAAAMQPTAPAYDSVSPTTTAAIVEEGSSKKKLIMGGLALLAVLKLTKVI